MAKTPDPLVNNVPIVDSEGRPSPLFIRQWLLLLDALRDAHERLAQLEGP